MHNIYAHIQLQADETDVQLQAGTRNESAADITIAAHQLTAQYVVG